MIPADRAMDIADCHAEKRYATAMLLFAQFLVDVNHKNVLPKLYHPFSVGLHKVSVVLASARTGDRMNELLTSTS